MPAGVRAAALRDWRRSAAMTFQRAPPEVNGLGVMTSMPGLVRSSQVLMLLRVALAGHDDTTTELVTMPLYWVLSQLAATMPAFDQPGHVGLERELDDVGRLARRPRRGSGRPTRRTTG